MVTDYFAYEKKLCRIGLIPALARQGFGPAGKAVLDVGCGYGGVLAALAEIYPLGRALGLDLDAEMIARGKAEAPAGVVLEARDFFSVADGGFDLIVLRDVLEHMPHAADALLKAASLLAPGGIIFASFAPFWSPFGGHQHNGAGFFANVPWLQALPEAWFRRALRLEGNSYKSNRALAEDMESVLRTRLTIGGFRRMLPAAGLRLERFHRYLIRPDFRLKFGLPAVGFPALPWIDELACTGVEAILAKAAT
ncbi:MAG: methyltransferase domain-containing protein [Fibrobacteres bacterium]|nr:methyltransferase domain-containing protein [Fibrobacterota bacterium]